MELRSKPKDGTIALKEGSQAAPKQSGDVAAISPATSTVSCCVGPYYGIPWIDWHQKSNMATEETLSGSAIALEGAFRSHLRAPALLLLPCLMFNIA